GNKPIVQIPRECLVLKQCVEIAGKRQPIFAAGVKQWAYSEVVPGAKQFALIPVPESKGKVAYQVVEALLSPGQIGVEDQLRIAVRRGQVGGVSAQLGFE